MHPLDWSTQIQRPRMSPSLAEVLAEIWNQDEKQMPEKKNDTEIWLLNIPS